MDTNELRKAASCVYIILPESVADDIAGKLEEAADTIDELRELFRQSRAEVAGLTE